MAANPLLDKPTFRSSLSSGVSPMPAAGSPMGPGASAGDELAADKPRFKVRCLHTLNCDQFGQVSAHSDQLCALHPVQIM